MSRYVDSSIVRRAVVLFALAAVPACHQISHDPSAGDPWLRTDLYFGLTRRDSSAIADADFQKFVDTAITPQFPDGLTITPAAGQYLDSRKQLHKEPSRILTILYPRKDAGEVTRKVQGITSAYCREFDQECVLQTTTPATARFLSAPVPIPDRR